MSETPETVAMRAIITVTYDAVAAHYPSSDPSDIAALDQEGLNEDPAIVLDMGESTIRVEPAVPRPLRVEVYSQRLVQDHDDRDDEPFTEYRWRVRHFNGEVMAHGEGYVDKRDRDHAVKVLHPDLDVVEVEG